MPSPSSSTSIYRPISFRVLPMAPPSAIDVPDVQAVFDTQAATFADRLSVNGVPARRSKAPKMSGSIAAHVSSDMFKSPV